MWIVAVGWAYVVILMAATETSVIAGIMTFFGYCVLPLSILFYISGAGRRRARRAGASAHAHSGSTARPDGVDAGLPLAHTGFFVPASEAAADCASADGGAGGDGGGGDGGCGGGD